MRGTLVRNLDNIYCEPDDEAHFNIPAGTNGIVICRTVDDLAEDESIEDGCEDAVVVGYILEGENVYYDALPEELEIFGYIDQVLEFEELEELSRKHFDIQYGWSDEFVMLEFIYLGKTEDVLRTMMKDEQTERKTRSNSAHE